jgi:hypothetical protein
MEEVALWAREWRTEERIRLENAEARGTEPEGG